MKNKKIFLVVCTLFFLLIFSETVYCSEIDNKENTIDLFYYEEDKDSMKFVNDSVYVNNLDVEEQIIFLLNLLFLKDDILCTPNNTEVTGVYIDNHNIYVNMNENILNHGGNYYESVLLSQIYKNIFQFDEIKNITILVNGRIKNFPEGQQIKNVTQYEDLSYGNIA